MFDKWREAAAKRREQQAHAEEARARLRNTKNWEQGEWQALEDWAVVCAENYRMGYQIGNSAEAWRVLASICDGLASLKRRTEK